MIERLKELLKNSYANYSNYKVSCIVETKNGKFYNGVNIENASYGATICAERVAIFQAIASGVKKHEFKKVYLLNSTEKIGTPCMLCRQVFLEFLDDEVEVICYNINGSSITYKVKDLCPYPFYEEDLR